MSEKKDNTPTDRISPIVGEDLNTAQIAKLRKVKEGILNEDPSEEEVKPEKN